MIRDYNSYREEIKYRYIRTYLSRLIQTEDEIKGFYGELKNKFLSYEKVKARISKKYESFNCGRKNLARLDVRGKKMNLYLALDHKEFAEKAQFYNFIDVSEKKKETPMLIKVSGPIKLRRALELVEILMEKIGAGVIENYEKVDYMMPYEDTDSLVRKGLIIDLWGQTPEVAEVQEIEEFAISASVEETSKNNAEEEKVKEELPEKEEVEDIKEAIDIFSVLDDDDDMNELDKLLNSYNFDDDSINVEDELNKDYDKYEKELNLEDNLENSDLFNLIDEMYEKKDGEQ
jgi:hypothetical protein